MSVHDKASYTHFLLRCENIKMLNTVDKFKDIFNYINYLHHSKLCIDQEKICIGSIITTLLFHSIVTRSWTSLWKIDFLFCDRIYMKWKVANEDYGLISGLLYLLDLWFMLYNTSCLDVRFAWRSEVSPTSDCHSPSLPDAFVYSCTTWRSLWSLWK